MQFQIQRFLNQFLNHHFYKMLQKILLILARNTVNTWLSMLHFFPFNSSSFIFFKPEYTHTSLGRWGYWGTTEPCSKNSRKGYCRYIYFYFFGYLPLRRILSVLSTSTTLVGRSTERPKHSTLYYATWYHQS